MISPSGRRVTASHCSANRAYGTAIRACGALPRGDPGGRPPGPALPRGDPGGRPPGPALPRGDPGGRPPGPALPRGDPGGRPPGPALSWLAGYLCDPAAKEGLLGRVLGQVQRDLVGKPRLGSPP